MQIFSNVAELRSALAQVRQQGRTIAFVPTMGNLHA
ncbi:MAG: pantoate--beta-alanine ligase, partial [Fluviibacter sp.]